MKNIAPLLFLFLPLVLLSTNSFATCGANTRKWQADAGTTDWNTTNNWIPRDIPSTDNENALIVSKELDNQNMNIADIKWITVKENTKIPFSKNMTIYATPFSHPNFSEEEIQISWKKLAKRIAVWEESKKKPLEGNHQSDYKIAPSNK